MPDNALHLPFPGAFSLQGELALITGGGTGLGLAMAQCFVAAGARVVICGRRKAELKRAATLLGPAATALQYDVTDCAAAPALVEKIRRRIGEVTILINNAGTHFKKSVEETEEDEFRKLIDTHVTGAFALTKAVIPAMKARGRGHILFTASMASLFGLPKVFAYATAKSAHLGMVSSLAVDLSPSGIRVNAIAPGWVETDLVRRSLSGDPERRERILKRTPLGRFATAEDIGWAAVYLSSPAACFVNGVVLKVDGGVSIGF